MNTAKLREVQEATYAAMLQCVKDFGICNVERPTGFGKTRLFLRFAREHKDSTILFIYDSDAVMHDIVYKYNPKNVSFMSYTRLSRKEGSEELLKSLVNSDYFAIIFDESHLMGGANISEFVNKLIVAVGHKKIILGGTATPMRTDGVHVTDRYFSGHTIYPYTIREAIADGLLTAPLYTAMVYSQKYMDKKKQQYAGKSYALKTIKQLEYVYAEKEGEPAVYRNAILQEFGEVPHYMKFIVFYPTIQSMKDDEEYLRQNFREAFPDRELSIIPITSDPDSFNNFDALEERVYLSPHTDLITCVNMLNQGYHSETLTGIVMNRSTLSNIVYTQQLGRCLNVSSDNKTVVFDNVSNCDVNPFAALVAMEEFANYRSSTACADSRGFRHLTFSVSAECKTLAEILSRIDAASNITEEMVKEAKWLYTVKKAPCSFAAQEYGVPDWLLEQELRESAEWEG